MKHKHKEVHQITLSREELEILQTLLQDVDSYDAFDGYSAEKQEKAAELQQEFCTL